MDKPMNQPIPLHRLAPLLVAMLSTIVLAQPATDPPVALLPEPIPLSDVVGQYKDADGPAELRVVNGSLTFRAKHTWDATYSPSSGRLTLSRIPKVEEMDPKIPEWARDRLLGRYFCTVRLTVRRGDEGRLVFDGAASFDRIAWKEIVDPFDDRIIERLANVTPGEEKDQLKVTLTRTGPLTPKLLYVRFVRKLDDFYVGLTELAYDEPLFVEALYDLPPTGEVEVPVKFGAGQQRSFKLTATTENPQILRGGPFVLTLPPPVANPATPAVPAVPNPAPTR